MKKQRALIFALLCAGDVEESRQGRAVMKVVQEPRYDTRFGFAEHRNDGLLLVTIMSKGEVTSMNPIEETCHALFIIVH